MRQIDHIHTNNTEQITLEIAIVDSISSEIPSTLMYCPGSITPIEGTFWTGTKFLLEIPNFVPYSYEKSVSKVLGLIFDNNYQNHLLLVKYSLADRSRTVVGTIANGTPGIKCILNVLKDYSEEN